MSVCLARHPSLSICVSVVQCQYEEVFVVQLTKAVGWLGWGCCGVGNTKNNTHNTPHLTFYTGTHHAPGTRHHISHKNDCKPSVDRGRVN